MANFHVEVGVVSRGKGKSITRAVSYVGRTKLYDYYKREHCSYPKKDLGMIFKVCKFIFS